MELLGSESTESAAQTEQKHEQAHEGDAPDVPKTHSTSFKLARLLYGGVLAFMAVNNLKDLEKYTQFAESKGAPMPEKSVPFVSGSLLFGGLGIAAWKLPRLAAGAIATFFVGITPVMHDFWAIEDEQETEQQMFHFLKNTALLGSALAFLRVAETDRQTD